MKIQLINFNFSKLLDTNHSPDHFPAPVASLSLWARGEVPGDACVLLHGHLLPEQRQKLHPGSASSRRACLGVTWGMCSGLQVLQGVRQCRTDHREDLPPSPRHQQGPGVRWQTWQLGHTVDHPAPGPLPARRLSSPGQKVKSSEKLLTGGWEILR